MVLVEARCKMKAVCSSETSESLRISRLYKLEERILHRHGCDTRTLGGVYALSGFPNATQRSAVHNDGQNSCSKICLRPGFTSELNGASLVSFRSAF
jgi:hypothetical protein